MHPLTIDSDECAALLYCCKNTVYELAEAGKLPAAKVGSSSVFVTEDVIGWLRQQIALQQRQRSELRPYVREDATGRKMRTTRAEVRKRPTLEELQAMLR